MSTQANSPIPETIEPLPAYSRILLATDSSDHANRGALEAASLANSWSSSVTAAHVYAAKMHDARFRQMEGGLPEQFREEQELERQRDVHDDLITRGLSVITDSYLDQVDRTCKEVSVKFRRRSLEGKNYRELVREANSGAYDLIIMGSLGLGAIAGSRIGGVCKRVARRTEIDMLVVKQPEESILKGPFVVGVDGSPQSFGALLMALSLAQIHAVQVKVVAAFDPYYHYVAFNRIADVLSEEAGKVFKFKEQEKLHEEIIDSGLAKIYQSHLDVARTIADDYGMEIETRLLDGKPHDAITRYIGEVDPSLLLIGKTGIHADPDLDIGGNTENLLINAGCAVLMTQRAFHPQVDVLADATTSWTKEAEKRMDNVPDFVRPMARMAILRYAQESGHTVITERIVEEATAQLMPRHAEQMMQQIVESHDQVAGAAAAKGSLNLHWTAEARQLLDSEALDDAVRSNVEFRAVKKARNEGTDKVQVQHVQAFLAQANSADKAVAQEDHTTCHWQAAALARLMKVPVGFMRDMSKQRVEAFAAERNVRNISLELVEQGLAAARSSMQDKLQEKRDSQRPAGTSGGRCPFANLSATGAPAATAEPGKQQPDTLNNIVWEPAACRRLASVPEGFCRDMTVRATEMIAGQQGLADINLQTVESVLGVFESGSVNVTESLAWTNAARERIVRAPDMVRGMLIKEIEAAASREQSGAVDSAMVEQVLATWQSGGAFHLDPDDSRKPQ